MFWLLLTGTFVSEDAASLAAGALIAAGELGAVTGVLAIGIGIYLGDLGLYAIGRAGRAWLRGGRGVRGLRGVRGTKVPRYVLRYVPRDVPRDGARSVPRDLARYLDEHAATAIMASRFLPGTRLPLYLAAGASGVGFGRFAGWSLVAVALWTPVVVGTAASAGAVASMIHPDSWLALGAALALAFVVLRSVAALATRRGRQRAVARVSRLWRWEFWPMWLFYAPVAVWVAWLALRYRGFGAVSAANPGMPDGGIVGESKSAILARLPQQWTIDAACVGPDTPDARVQHVRDVMAARGWDFPLVVKPDVGQRGTGVKLVRHADAAREYLAREARAVLVQPYHPGPFEAGVFYVRQPGEARGRIFSITDKQFPFALGDGRSTLEELIWSDSRLRMQARTFLSRLGADRHRVPADGERVPLAVAGNHAQGTLFRDGMHLWSPALEARIDEIARAYEGFYIGRFDIRYRRIDGFRDGTDLAIVELNGALAESTNIYDPSRSLLAAYRQLFRQWSLVFAVGAANRRRGAPASRPRRLLALVREHLSTPLTFQTSD